MDKTTDIIDKPRLTLRKSERLHHHTLVEQLFNHGESLYAYPLRMFCIVRTKAQMQELFHGILPSDIDRLQMMITVPKKKFKHAVDRVWVRRRIREAYRLHRSALKQKLYDDEHNRYLLLAFIYAGDTKREYAAIEKKMIKLLDKAALLIEPVDTSSSTTADNE
ncbi:MAG: ribonuclease P protein component [Muribaculaceae bacterium]|nr:ribonuclease P protein component [Muribaculaceae bacterium]